MSTPYCRHIKTNGRRCRSFAMRDKPLCFFHNSLNARHRSLSPKLDPTPTIIHPMQIDFDHAQRNPLVAEYFGLKPKGPLTLDLPALEDRESIQVAISMLVRALGQNQLEPKRANTMLYALQVASNNAASLNFEHQFVVRDSCTDETGLEISPDEDPEEVHDFERYCEEHANDEDDDDDDDEPEYYGDDDDEDDEADDEVEEEVEEETGDDLPPNNADRLVRPSLPPASVEV